MTKSEHQITATIPNSRSGLPPKKNTREFLLLQVGERSNYLTWDLGVCNTTSKKFRAWIEKSCTIACSIVQAMETNAR
jgi:hypothetical protein